MLQRAKLFLSETVSSDEDFDALAKDLHRCNGFVYAGTAEARKAFMTKLDRELSDAERKSTEIECPAAAAIIVAACLIRDSPEGLSAEGADALQADVRAAYRSLGVGPLPCNWCP